jgi:chaperonin GroEL (HSP60 family)
MKSPSCRQCSVGWVWLQILVELAGLQDQEVGDGTTSVVIVAAELLKRANDLVRNRIHPTSIITGYRMAMREVSKTLSRSTANVSQVAFTCCISSSYHYLSVISRAWPLHK